MSRYLGEMRRWGLRDEVMIEARDDGGVDLLDPLFERLDRLDAATVERLDAGDSETMAALDARLLRANPVADAARRAAWYARLRPEPARPDAASGDVSAACEAAATLGWAEAWRSAERWRRFVEGGRAAGGVLGCGLRLDGLFPAALAEAAAEEAMTEAVFPLTAAVVSAHRAVVTATSPPALAATRALLDDAATRRIVGLALERPLDQGALHLNLWRLLPGERMAVHPDGSRYAATVAIGLNAGWNAEHGGAIAFGTPGAEGLAVHTRWLPHAGDTLVFAPGPTTWHAVEPPTRTRWTLSGWWFWPESSP
ncbi:hypothetical protein LBMAG42_32870 [Deltaproteobacteria bacterium]|nr:hypothetical protein LBMAG42_32870 [Deltaproteobacteria bacterium]